MDEEKRTEERINDDYLYEIVIDRLAHYGTPRHSGRYPWGSGKNPQRNRHFLQRVDELTKQGLSQKEVAKAMGMSTGDLRQWKRHIKYQQGMENQQTAMKLHDKGYSNVAIAEKLGVSEGTVRNYLDPTKKMREDRAQNIADGLKEVLKEKPYLDVGEGVHRQLNISEEHLQSALMVLEDEGYNVLPYRLPQVSNPRQFTNLKILCDGDKTKADITEHLSEVTSPDGIYFEDYGDTIVRLKPIPSVDSSRVQVRYTEDGGSEKDGVIEIRPGTEDLSLGGRNYAQVRIAVDGTHYLKGMAIYGDPKTMPDGCDILFNTNKHEGTPMLGEGDSTVLKAMKNDPQNPFGASFRQWEYPDSAGKFHVSPINIVNDDEDWEGWKKNLSSQFLSKQMPALAKRQLDLRYAEMADQFDEYKSITNPTLKKEFLEEFADSCDSAAVHLKAAALPRQGSFAILPVTSLKDNEVYAPMYENGEEVILVRHPHAGTFELPRLTVNNDNKEGKAALGTTASHAIGINSHVAAQLSGADYDGDTVLVIPTKNQKLKTDKPLEGLKDFNPTEMYSRHPDDPYRTGKGDETKKGDHFNKGMEMGKASNLITDMTIRGATIDEIERAVKHSMVVIDAEKHNLDWKKSEVDNGIAELRDKYQDGGGASTLISRAKGETRVPERKEKYGWSKMTEEERERYNNGEVIYRETNRTFKDKGKVRKAETTITKMESVKDANELSYGTYIESIYANYANNMKAMANEARKEARATGKLEMNKSAAKAYEDVVGPDGSLQKKIRLAELEAPKERQAQAIAASVMAAKITADPSLKMKDNADKRKKLAAKALENARDAVNGGTHKKRYRIDLTDREWEAIQAGAISDTKFRKVIQYSDKEELKKRALPKASTEMRSTTRSRALMLLNSGLAPSTVAKEVGVSVQTLAKEFNNFNGMTVEGGV